MGKRRSRIAHFIRLAELAGLRNDIPLSRRNRSFVAHGSGCCLVMADNQIAIRFGEATLSEVRPPQLVLRPAVNESWELTLEPDDIEIPAEVIDFAKKFSLEPDMTISVTDDDMLDGILDKFFTRVRPALASAS